MITSGRHVQQPRKTPNGQVLTAARMALEASPLFRGRTQLIQMHEKDGTLSLEGRLPSYYLKQMLQTLLRDVDGVEQINNCVAVDSLGPE